MFATWKLWIPQTEFPQVPLLRLAGELPAWIEWVSGVAVVTALVGFVIASSRRAVAWLSGGFLLAMTLLVAVDQHRLQPWAFQAMVMVVVFATCDSGDVLRLLRLLVISIYVFSALGKFDYEFLHTLGQQFLSTLTSLCHIPDQFWSEWLRLSLAALFPLGELLIGVGLSWRVTRRGAVIVAVVMHCMLLLILGPWGLNHQAGVLLWNIFFIFQAILLFWPIAHAEAKTPSEVASSPHRRWSLVGTCVIYAVVVLPCLEWFGYYDHWLAWGLYSPRNSRVECYIDERVAEQIPASLRQHLQVSQEDLSILRLRMDHWSLQALGCPIYPQDRFQVGVARAVASRYALGEGVMVERLQPANRWTGQRVKTRFQGAAGLTQLSEQFFLNATPRLRFHE